MPLRVWLVGFNTPYGACKSKPGPLVVKIALYPVYLSTVNTDPNQKDQQWWQGNGRFVASVIALKYPEALLDTAYDFVVNFKASFPVEIESETLNL